MPYEIEKKPQYLSVRLWGQARKFDIVRIVAGLHALDRRKTRPDVWRIAPESMVPFLEFPEVVKGLVRLFPPKLVDNRTALIAGDTLHRAQLEIFRAEAADLPLDLRIFLSESEAFDWLGIVPDPSLAVDECA